MAVLNEIDNGSASDAATLAKKISILDAMMNLQIAWESVRTETILNCWRKGGLDVTEGDDGDVEDPIDDAALYAPTDDVTQEQWDAFIDIDADVQVTEKMTDESIVEQVLSQMYPENTENNTDSSDDEEEVPIPTRKEMMEHFNKLKLGLVARGFDDILQLKRLGADVERLTRGEMKQSKLSMFFKQ